MNKNSDNEAMFIEKDLFSIIIPEFNQKEMIETVIDSVYASTYKNIEVIAVNDGSTDDSGRVLDSLREKFPNLKVVHKANEGKRKDVSSGFQQSIGKFIILIDSDSIIDRNAIEEFAKVFKSDPTIGAVAGQAKIFNANENTLTKCQDSWYDYEYNIYKAYESYLGTVTCCSGCLAGYRSEAIENVLINWSNNEEKVGLYGLNTLSSHLERIKSISKIRTILLDKIYNIRFILLNSLLSYDDS